MCVYITNLLSKKNNCTHFLRHNFFHQKFDSQIPLRNFAPFSPQYWRMKRSLPGSEAEITMPHTTNGAMSYDNAKPHLQTLGPYEGAYVDSPYAIGLRKLSYDTTPSAHINGGFGRCSPGTCERPPFLRWKNPSKTRPKQAIKGSGNQAVRQSFLGKSSPSTLWVSRKLTPRKLDESRGHEKYYQPKQCILESTRAPSKYMLRVGLLGTFFAGPNTSEPKVFECRGKST